jgi:16S rRNA (guanine966-N2)-methyltransferase
LRIIAGSRKGARLYAPKGLDVRPTGDRVREAVFNLVGPVDGADVLDLFAGTGALGLEALSRGAASAVFVDSDRAAAETIVKNVDKLGLDGAHIYREDASRRLASEVAAGRRYDLVLVDPPYRMLSKFLPMLATRLPAVVSPDGLVVVESEAKEEPELPLPLRTSRTYGSTRVTLFEGVR